MNVVKVKSGDSFAIINESDYDPDSHELFEGESVGKRSSVQDFADEAEIRRQIEANRGVVSGTGLAETDRNTTGTFSTPTPTDVRFPDKNATEFENNHGATVNRSAADLRAEKGMEDKPGGIMPEEAARVEAASAAVADLSNPAARSEIPADWSDLHWQKQVKLAEQISGRTDLNTAGARDIIEAELARRG